MNDLIKRMAQEASVIIFDGIGYQVCDCDFDESQFLDDEDEMGMRVLDEETQDSMFIAYSEVNFARGDMFYKLVMMEENDYIDNKNLTN
ncbi:hypothetical protein UFOVP1655_140 [uncultured Caudovirales phage]|uniref:Uncharacterized protein n=1 Tax=uncultured Caudovirales phage TaxID=2100421 RepID=A0A6J5T4S5_9CAUD|nr:hypothetical protein UFOVP1655_140 [uncultured Caudovirales phage]